jgi:hypothetical protein
MLTFFTTCKPHLGHDGIVQRNALKSWMLLHPDVEVILFGDDEGSGEVCAELGLRYEPQVERFESKVPLVSSMFARAQQIARHKYLCYSNCDIILMKDFRAAFERAVAWQERFLMIAQRWDVDITQEIDFQRGTWADDVYHLALTSGQLQAPGFMDFFVFPKGFYDQIPPLVVGYAYWDHWMVWKALATRCPVLDVSPFVVPVHQNHEYTTTPERKKGSRIDATAMRNFELSGNGKHLRSMIDSTHRMGATGEIRRTRFRRFFESAAVLSLRQTIAEKTLPLRDRLGLRRRKPERTLGGTVD